MFSLYVFLLLASFISFPQYTTTYYKTLEWNIIINCTRIIKPSVHAFQSRYMCEYDTSEYKTLLSFHARMPSSFLQHVFERPSYLFPSMPSTSWFLNTPRKFTYFYFISFSRCGSTPTYVSVGSYIREVVVYLKYQNHLNPHIMHACLFTCYLIQIQRMHAHSNTLTYDVVINIRCYEHICIKLSSLVCALLKMISLAAAAFFETYYDFKENTEETSRWIVASCYLGNKPFTFPYSCT
jgi:hypothetical protein